MTPREWFERVIEEYGLTPAIVFGDDRIGGDYRSRVMALVFAVLDHRGMSHALIAKVVTEWSGVEEPVTRDTVFYRASYDYFTALGLTLGDIERQHDRIVPLPHEVKDY